MVFRGWLNFSKFSMTRQMLVDFQLGAKIAISKISDARKNVKPGNKTCDSYYKLVTIECYKASLAVLWYKIISS